MGTCWTLPKVSAKLHILWILAWARAFRRARGIMKQEKQLSDLFINYISVFKRSYVLTCFWNIVLFPIINKIWLSLYEPGLASTRCGLKAPSETCDVWRGDILAGIQLIVHQSGRAAMTLFNSLYSRQMTTAAMPFKTSEKNISPPCLMH